MNDVIRAFLKITIIILIIWIILGYIFDQFILKMFELSVPIWIFVALLLSGFVFSIAISFSLIYEKYLWKEDR
jgi:RsiW-degrading membrane proteinase PrsW (M82 family)